MAIKEGILNSSGTGMQAALDATDTLGVLNENIGISFEEIDTSLPSSVLPVSDDVDSDDIDDFEEMRYGVCRLTGLCSCIRASYITPVFCISLPPSLPPSLLPSFSLLPCRHWVIIAYLVLIVLLLILVTVAVCCGACCSSSVCVVM